MISNAVRQHVKCFMYPERSRAHSQDHSGLIIINWYKYHRVAHCIDGVKGFYHSY